MLILKLFPTYIHLFSHRLRKFKIKYRKFFSAYARFLFHANRAFCACALFLPCAMQTETTWRLKTSCHAAVTFLHNFPSNFDRNALTCWLSRTFSHTTSSFTLCWVRRITPDKKVLHMAELKIMYSALALAARRWLRRWLHWWCPKCISLLAGCCQQQSLLRIGSADDH